MPKKLDGHIDEILDMVREGKTYRQIAEHYSVSVATVSYYFDKSEHSARIKDALVLNASVSADKAEDVLLSATTDFELKKARELAQHYRWKASKRNPRSFGDKITTEHEGGLKVIVEYEDGKVKD